MLVGKTLTLDQKQKVLLPCPLIHEKRQSEEEFK